MGGAAERIVLFPLDIWLQQCPEPNIGMGLGRRRGEKDATFYPFPSLPRTLGQLGSLPLGKRREEEFLPIVSQVVGLCPNG